MMYNMGRFRLLGLKYIHAVCYCLQVKLQFSHYVEISYSLHSSNMCTIYEILKAA